MRKQITNIISIDINISTSWSKPYKSLLFLCKDCQLEIVVFLVHRGHYSPKGRIKLL